MKIPKKQSKAVNQRTGNTMAKRKRDNKKHNNLQNTTQNTKDRET